MECGENIFTEYLPYVGGTDTTSKEELLKHFESFLEFPEHDGIFVVRWKENETFENRYSLDEYIKQIHRGEKRENNFSLFYRPIFFVRLSYEIFYLSNFPDNQIFSYVRKFWSVSNFTTQIPACQIFI